MIKRFNSYKPRLNRICQVKINLFNLFELIKCNDFSHYEPLNYDDIILKAKKILLIFIIIY